MKRCNLLLTWLLMVSSAGVGAGDRDGDGDRHRGYHRGDGYYDHRDRGHHSGHRNFRSVPDTRLYIHYYGPVYPSPEVRYYAPAYRGLGRVLSVTPIYGPLRHYPGECIHREYYEPRRSSYTPTVLGTILGAAAGHSIGDAHGDADLAAVAGGLLGATVGSDIARSQTSYSRVESSECYGGGASRDIVEYQVTYRYNGEVFHTYMDYHPGDWIELDVVPRPR